MTSKTISASSSASGIDTKKINTNFEYKYQSINIANEFEKKYKSNLAKLKNSKSEPESLKIKSANK
jgi:hypothetical protein